MRKRIYIETYGCQMNINDTELIAGLVTKDGFELTEDPKFADVILVNTCAVREHAEARVIGRLADLNRQKLRRPEVLIGVLGCMAQHLGEKIIKAAPYVDLVLGPDSYRHLPGLIKQNLDEPFLDLRLEKTENYEDITPLRKEGIKAWVTIMRGCDKFCTFCIVPYVRGRERSLPLETIVKDVELLSQEGFKEVTLLGQTVNSYHDGKGDFSDLLEALAKVDGIRRIRFTSPHPSDVTDKQIETMAKYDRICKHLHLPLQSGSDRVLKLMRRSYGVEEYLSIVEKLRNAMPNIGITTDVIVGFCSETEEDFQETYDLMKNVRYDSAFMFKYSPREGTIAYRKFIDDVPEEEKLRRLSQIIALQEKISLEVNRAFIGKTVEVLVEGESKKGSNQFFGKTDDFKTAVFPKEDAKIGDIVKVKVSDATSHTLFGKIV